MKLKILILGIVTVCMYLLFLLTIKPYDEDTRDVYGIGEQAWMTKNHLILPSKWRHVTPPTPNNGADLNQKNFVTTKKGGFQSKKEYLFVRSLQAWRPNSDPGSNHEHNSIGPVAEKNFVGSELKKKRVLLLSLQKKGPVTSPGPNRGHNSIGENNFDGSKLKKEPINPPAPSPIHNHPVNIFSEKNFADRKMASAHPPPFPLVVNCISEGY